MFCNKSFWIVIGKVALIFVLAAICTIVAVLVINGLQQCKLFESIDSEGTILTFVGLLATFIVIVNYQQVQEAKDYIRNKQQEIDRLIDEIKKDIDAFNDIDDVLIDYFYDNFQNYHIEKMKARYIGNLIFNANKRPITVKVGNLPKIYNGQYITHADDFIVTINGFSIIGDRHVSFSCSNTPDIDSQCISSIKYDNCKSTLIPFIANYLIKRSEKQQTL